MSDRYYHYYPAIFWDELRHKFIDNTGKVLTVEEWEDYLWHNRQIDVRDAETRKFKKSIQEGNRLREAIMKKRLSRNEIKVESKKYRRFDYHIEDEVIIYDEDDPNVFAIDKLKLGLMLDAAASYAARENDKIRAYATMAPEVMPDQDEEPATIHVGTPQLTERYKQERSFELVKAYIDAFIDEVAELDIEGRYGVYIVGVGNFVIQLKVW